MLEVVEWRAGMTEAVVVSGFGPDAQWYRNVPAGGTEEVRIGRARFRARARVLDEGEAEAVLAGYERRNRLATPVVRFVLGRLTGFRYDGSPAARRRVVSTLPVRRVLAARMIAAAAIVAYALLYGVRARARAWHGAGGPSPAGGCGASRAACCCLRWRPAHRSTGSRTRGPRPAAHMAEHLLIADVASLLLVLGLHWAAAGTAAAHPRAGPRR